MPLEIKVMLELRPGSDCVQTEWGGIVKGEWRQPGWEPEVIAKAKKKKNYGKYCILVWVSDTIRSPPPPRQIVSRQVVSPRACPQVSGLLSNGALAQISAGTRPSARTQAPFCSFFTLSHDDDTRGPKMLTHHQHPRRGSTIPVRLMVE